MHSYRNQCSVPSGFAMLRFCSHNAQAVCHPLFGCWLCTLRRGEEIRRERSSEDGGEFKFIIFFQSSVRGPTICQLCPSAICQYYQPKGVHFFSSNQFTGNLFKQLMKLRYHFQLKELYCSVIWLEFKTPKVTPKIVAFQKQSEN